MHLQAVALAGCNVADAISPIMAQAVLASPGQTTESAWPYNSITCLAQDPAYFHIITEFFAFSVDMIVAALKNGNPVVLVLGIGEEFYEQYGLLTEDKIKPEEALHAIVISGTKLENSIRWFHVRNSWGEGWGTAGYKWATAAYLEKRASLTLFFGGAT